MYARIAEFQSTSKVNCDMIIAFFQNVMIPRNIKNGQISCEVYRVSETTGFGGLAKTVDWYLANEAWWRPLLERAATAR